MKRIRYCLKCGKYTGKKGNLCSEHALESNKELPEPDTSGLFDTTQEICEGNLNIRLREGFELLSEE